MPLVAYKYMVDEMPVGELRATFAAREQTLEYLVSSLRKQAGSTTLTSYLITGPRGAGKTTIVRMFCLAIDDDPELRAAWLPVRFPEELRGVSSLRDLLAAALERLAQEGIADAQEGYKRVQDQMDDEQSQELAIGALRQIGEKTGKRLVLFVENLDQLFDRALDKRSEATLRRLLMVEPFMMVVGTALHVFGALGRYDQALFNYFCPVPLGRMNDRQVHDLLLRRAEFDGNVQFADQYPRHVAKIQALTRLTGGNPRLIMMLYEVLSHGDFTSVASALEQLVDELTPLLKDILDHQFSTQQSAILDALMRAGGTANPAELARAARIPLNNVTQQLKRLKEMQVLEVLGGGKGRTAYYTVPDQPFCTWYQMRYLRPHRRRIELFVDMLRIWFEEAQRLRTVQSLAASLPSLKGKAARDALAAVEYFGASLAATPYAGEARDLIVSGYLRLGDLDDAALALADYSDIDVHDRRRYEAAAYSGLGDWAQEHGDWATAVNALRAALDREPGNYQIELDYGMALALSGDHQAAFAYFDKVVGCSPSDSRIMTGALINRGVEKGQQGDIEGEIADYTAVIELEAAPKDLVAQALIIRGAAKGQQGDIEGEITDYTAVIGNPASPGKLVAQAFLHRGIASDSIDKGAQAFEDYLAAGSHSQAQKDCRVEALERAFLLVWRDENSGGMEMVSAAAANGLAALALEEGVGILVAVCQALAQPEMKEAWPQILRSLLATQPPEVVERLGYLLPVANVLETNDSAKLNPLPPEQRQFAQEVLQRFIAPRKEETAPLVSTT